MVFVDGENLCVRFERMCKEAGKIPLNTVQHEVGAFVWRKGFTFNWPLDVLRVTYYTSVAGTDDGLKELQDRMAKLHWARSDNHGGRMVPRVFKKAKSGEKTKSVDINLCVDILRHCYADDLDTVVLMSGDGDYLPLLREVMRRGKQAIVAAFSSGLNPEIGRTVDGLQILDDRFFEEK